MVQHLYESQTQQNEEAQDNHFSEDQTAIDDILDQNDSGASPVFSLLKQINDLASRQKQSEHQAEVSKKMLSMTSHDLMSPINAITGYLDLMKHSLDAGVDPDQLADYRMRIKSGISDLSAIVQNLRELAHSESVEDASLPCEVDINWVVREVCEIMDGAAVAKEHVLISTFTSTPAHVNADIPQLKRVIYNLVSNAIKYTHRGGLIRVNVRKERNEVKVIVRDNGIGIPEEEHCNIFKPNNKLQSCGTEDEPSSGLGLYICSRFAEAMNGYLTVESEQNKGSVFTLHLPNI
ncbi:sensor histidine kinase [Natronogracilivirga saccharolytica]|uniref:histidine kinase n=1 Tax=Natronogracilivirga saccharolytica TaxID=2812953 RepID=A0A8J7S4T0_9BACT|nr:HAMP domain-containing sensor histidine kinase [Natronogracilivirga saccharolytica]MBP3191983.1 HAMP domain-containing histidine kinase [Natronogracilivirga saccharolytica]